MSETPKRGRPKKYSEPEYGAPRVSIRVDPDVHEHIASRPEGARLYIERLVREDRDRPARSPNISSLETPSRVGITENDLIDALGRDLVARGIGQIYSTSDLSDLLEAAGRGRASEDELRRVVGTGKVVIHFRGGWAGVQVSLTEPNRQACLHAIDQDSFSLDTEFAIQAGTQRWFERWGYQALREVPDETKLWDQIASIPGLGACAQLPASARTACRRDLLAHDPEDPTGTFHIWEAKGKTKVEGDFYETFGQIFPIADSDVTLGWTVRKVPKHGLALALARCLYDQWAKSGKRVRITLGVLVPDFPPPGWDPNQFYDGPTLYYPNQMAIFRQFLESSDAPGNDAFARLLRHLRDEFGLQQMLGNAEPIQFRLMGYQGSWIRDFGTNSPFQLVGSS